MISSHLIAKSAEIAKVEGIDIPHTVDEYTKRLLTTSTKTHTDDMQDYLLDDDDEDQSEDNQSTDDYSQSSRMKINIQSTMKHENNNNSSGDSNKNEDFYAKTTLYKDRRENEYF